MKGKIIALISSITLFLTACGLNSSPTNNKIGSIIDDTSSAESFIEETKKQEEEVKFAKVGEYVEGDTWKISLLSAKQYNSIGEEYLVFSPSVEGNKFLVLFFEVENISKTDNHFNMFYMESYADGYAIGQTLLINNIDNFEMLGGDLASGKKMKGYVAYEVSADWKEFEFSYKDWISSSNKVATFLITPDQLSN